MSLRRALSFAVFVPALALAQQASQAPRVEYQITFPHAAQHEAQVVATFRGVAAGQPLALRMSRSSPGRYAVHEFAKNVYDVRAVDGRGRALTLERPDPYGWTATGHDGTVTVTYTVFGDRTDGTYLGVDETHAHMNMPATFLWARGLETAPIRLAIQPRAGWRVFTQLRPTADSLVFTAPNLQYFMDSPTEVGPSMLRSWTVTTPGRVDTVRVALHSLATEAQVDSFARMTKDVVAEHFAFMGAPQGFDFGKYTFLVDYLPWASGDGMEHRNSTIVSGRGGANALAGRDAQVARLGTMSHEFFHSWNVERLRPRGLEPFDFERANMSDELWLAEGFTQYVGPLMIRRAGIYSDDEYVRQLGGNIVQVIESPARRYGSPVEMSRRAPFVDAATAIDPTNFSNIHISYYTWGAAVAAALDLTLRDRFGLALDDYMRALWNDYGRAQTAALAPAHPYTRDDLRHTLGRLTKDTAFANDFFRRYIEGREVPDYARLLAKAGLRLAGDSVPRPYLGASLVADTAGVAVNFSVVTGSLWPAGVMNGDIIHAVDGETVRTPEQLDAIVMRHRVGDTLTLDVTQRVGRHTVKVPLVGSTRLRLVTYESAGLPVTEEMRAFRSKWWGSRAVAR